MITAGIVGISGYSGGKTLELLLRHDQVRVTYVSANNSKGTVADLWPHLRGKTDLVCDTFDADKAAELCDVVFLAVPHTVAMALAPRLLAKSKRVIDLSADYRIDDESLYAKWYGKAHIDEGNLKKAVYGLPELCREKIKDASLIANPGCYPTAALLALAPLVATQTERIQSIIIDAKSGVSGAGKKPSPSVMFTQVNENFMAYKVMTHQHTPEIDQYLTRLAGQKIGVTFVPHLLPVHQGILETIYVSLKPDGNFSTDQINDIYIKFYKKEPFVRVLPPGTQPELKNVRETNYCDIGLVLDQKKNMLVITSAIDNLIKGASGQAVQNMNIMFNFPETKGLIS